MSKKSFMYVMLPVVLLLCTASLSSMAGSKQKSANAESGTLEKMIVASGSVAMDLDLNRLNGFNVDNPKGEALHFAVAANSFFTVMVFNDALRGPEQGAMALIPRNSATLPGVLRASLNQLVVEKLSSGEPFDLAVRDGKTGFPFFNIEGHQYDYDANAQLLSIADGRLVMSQEFADLLGRPAEAGSVMGKISIGIGVQPVEIATVANGAVQSVTMPPVQHAGAESAQPAAGTAPGPDVIVGDLPSVEQGGSSAGFVGLGVGTTSCNNGQEPLHWFALPNPDHPVIPQNLYRMSGGTDNTERFEQIGQSWLKHAFAASEGNDCGLGCSTSGCTTGTNLCSGCSDPYSASLNYSQFSLGSRAWVNPFTGVFPGSPSPNNHAGHTHTGTSHRVTVATTDLDATHNPGATYFAEGQYVTPHEYTWCQANPGECNMNNNVSYRQFSVRGTATFRFTPVGSTVQKTPAIFAWTGATITQMEPDPGNDGIAFVGYKVTNPSTGVWHYEYAIYNQNLDRAIQSFAVPTARRVRNISFHAPPQEPGWPNDNTVGNTGYSSTPWTSVVAGGSLTWSCETIAQNANANAIRWGTLYNFRFDSNRPPQDTSAVIGFFKTGAPITVPIQGPQ
jgi:hypothetical protein